jgi:excisionase family DNA binding protein
MPERLFTVPEVAERLGTGERFVRRLIAERRIAFVRLGPPGCSRGPVRIPETAVLAFVQAGRVDVVREGVA